MGFFDSITELFESAAPWTTVEAEAVRGGQGTEPTPARPSGDDDEGEAKDSAGPTPDKHAEVVDEEKSGGGDDDSKDGEEEEEEEEEEEPEDPKAKFEEECKESKQCAPAKHHFDECVERVTAAEGDHKGPKEDCVEEFFHLAHCANACAAPKLWSVLK